MEFLRTANAGGVISMDGVRILLDGVCQGAFTYRATPEQLRKDLMDCPPDVLVWTHTHADHCDKGFLAEFQEKYRRPLIGAADLPGAMTDACIGGVEITAVPTRHIGKAALPHFSIFLKGSKTVLCTGDASPLQWKADTPVSDVLIAPFAYAATPNGWETAKRLGRQIILVHLPDRDRDPKGLWQAVEQTVGHEDLYIPAVGQTVEL